MGFEYKYVAQVGDCSEVADHPRKTYLCAGAFINTKTQRVFDRPLHNSERDSFSPIRVGEKAVHHFEVKPRPIGTNHKLFAPVFNDLGRRHFRPYRAAARIAH